LVVIALVNEKAVNRIPGFGDARLRNA